MLKSDHEIHLIENYLLEGRERIEKHLSSLIPETQLPYDRLFKAARYALLGGGKRLRPLLALATSETLGTSSSMAINVACALEMVHAYSLIHDDLPCMDNDDFRRGKPTVHKAFDEAHAVLAGDYLLAQAFEVIATDQSLSSDQKIALVSLLARKGGGEGMVAGQVLDIESEGKRLTQTELAQIHTLKTGAMITASIEFGCIIANASTADTQELRLFGDEIGLAFQIIDDVIDVAESVQKHGKNISSDAVNNKTTYVTLLGKEAAEKQAYNLLDKALKRLNSLPYDTTILSLLAKKLVLRTT